MLNIFDMTVKVIKFTGGITEISISPLGKLIPDIAKAGLIYLFSILSVFPHPGREEIWILHHCHSSFQLNYLSIFYSFCDSTFFLTARKKLQWLLKWHPLFVWGCSFLFTGKGPKCRSTLLFSFLFFFSFPSFFSTHYLQSNLIDC